MTIVRELITKLGFQFDKSNLNKFESSIIGFKTKFAIASTTIGLAFKGLTDAATTFSDKLINIDALSKFSKIPVEILEGMRNAFATFDIPSDTFNRIFQDLSFGIKQASKGQPSPFLELVKQSQGAVRLFVDGQITTSKQAFDDIMEYLKKLNDESEKQRIIQNIFGVDLVTATNLSNLFKLTNNELDELIKKQSRSPEEIEKATESAKNFKKEINTLSTEWGKFSDKIVQSTVGPLADFFGSINKFSDNVNDKGFFQTILDNAKENEAIIYKQALGAVPRHLQKNRKVETAEDRAFLDSREDSTNIINNNNFEFNVPPGTPEEQSKFQTDQIIKAIDSMWEQKTREVFNNNPQIEV